VQLGLRSIPFRKIVRSSPFSGSVSGKKNKKNPTCFIVHRYARKAVVDQQLAFLGVNVD
jgi:hypothetical protein